MPHHHAQRRALPHPYWVGLYILVVFAEEVGRHSPWIGRAGGR